MGKFSGSGAAQIAKDAITAALNSGSIKLLGTGNADVAARNAQSDATYLATLANSLYEQLKSKGDA